MTEPFSGSSARADSARAGESRPEQDEPVVIRDKRRIDPNGETPLHTEDPLQAAEEALVSDEIVEAERQLAERTADLQRLQAEFANYRKRVDRDRVIIGEQAAGKVVAALLPVLDDIDRARQHGDLDGAFKAVADQLDGILAKFGLASFGEVGDPFSPELHEAVMHSESEDVQVPTCTTVMRRGYRQGERLLRPAMVGVSDPVDPVVAGPFEPDSDESAAPDPVEESGS
ncbi:molecular chaperone GrpE [Jatrophihabitans sp. GAS493]|uniref:nucleotide exchange factor GrpE n=1 Tax=Jatrophihabitans sp. GAS493 TaxID=1907575 RepID=UPI000BB820F6|nr:nucleotide exchange factor GrpE [Jatrophihabitans sp. GAS493]SOD71543.1 molecular chaperone GrpE [Jatrophihabitans sp. GAS493]